MSSHRFGITLRKSPFTGWLDAFVLVVVAAGGVLLAVSGEFTILLVYVVVVAACATVGAALDSRRWLLAAECVALGLYLVLLVVIIGTSAGSWDRRSYDVTEGTLAIMAIYWVTILLLVIFGGMTVGATARRRIDLTWLGATR